ncbi:valine--tRNA ligase [Hyphococcus flavus]|uniref:Valine--tRNA ligase n=1 Tax=Hyphococcus flavus TaxID=1866326 RepID=A0AAE9ZAC0_9PROT|nr:valine--tRNA ligase [Hyphococcus flavus]WDI30563.1 valine--tRNA ligase [Hyphococcus flavus]
MLEKNFDFQSAEKRIYEAWEKSGAFKPSDSGEAYSIVIPPPNVTGSLHMGHALNNTLQDVLCRFERMRGKSVLWQPGTDHAGIATQMVVERQLMENQEPSRRDMGREKFVERVWQWKEQSGGQIINQLKRLGATCDWSRERFTMDKGLSEAVIKVFVQLYNEGLIYRDKRLVNWDPKFETAISDLEVENIETQGHFWHFKYPLENGETYEFPIAYDDDGNPTEWETRDYISIATTRPETMLGDGAVAVHPDDKRYAPIVGKNCILPLADRPIPIITDEYPDPDFGSGAVKITGAHDFNDYQVALRNNIEMYDLMDSKARMVDADYVPEKYRGMDRYDARKAVVEDIDARGLLIQVEDKKIMQPFGDRSGVVIEPIRTDQWYVDAKTLAKPAIEAVETSKTRIIPENWSKTYFQWMRNIEPWCVSRQLWWGHRIPAWYGPDGSIFVAETEEEATKDAIAKYTSEGYSLEEINDMRRHEHGGAPLLVRDDDVLDTWFSSALWPFSTLGWPEKTPELEKFYPTSTLVTAHDIIFFWVARMMMDGIHFMKEVPFKDVYIHALVLDEKGQKMSKSKGNVIDPLVLIDKYGADALRFTLAAQAAQGRNIRLSESRVEGYRNFATKLWNAARFCEMNECKPDESFDPAKVTSTINQWIIHEANDCAAAVTREIEAFRFNDAAGAIYKFTWNVFCDWYLELAKPTLQGDDKAAKKETRAAAAWALDRILMLLHPFMPFVTEEIWGAFAKRDALITAAWPQYEDKLANKGAADEVNWAIDLITGIRSVRQEMNVPVAAKIPLAFIGGDAEDKKRLTEHGDVLKRLARLSDITVADAAPKGAVQIVHGAGTVALPVADFIDIAAEKARLEKEKMKIEKEIVGIDKKLANKNFVDRAPKEVVEEQHTRRADYVAQLEKLDGALARLADL